jgi:hypothetical protein
MSPEMKDFRKIVESFSLTHSMFFIFEPKDHLKDQLNTLAGGFLSKFINANTET